MATEALAEREVEQFTESGRKQLSFKSEFDLQHTVKSYNGTVLTIMAKAHNTYTVQQATAAAALLCRRKSKRTAYKP